MATPLASLRRLARNVGWLARQGFASGWLRGRFWLRVRLRAPLLEGRAPLLFPGRDATLALVDLLATLEAAAGDPAVRGVLVDLGNAPEGLAQGMALRRALASLRERGKPVIAYGEVLGAEALLVGSGASRLYMPPSGSLFLVGLRLEGFFLGELLERLGVRADVVRVGDYKTAAETFLRRDMSPEQREQLGHLLEDRYEALVTAVAEGRSLDPEVLRGLVDEGPYPATEAAQLGLVDDCLYPDELEERLEAESPGSAPGEGRPVRCVDAPVYHALRVADPGWLPLFQETPRVAYVVASGPIRRGAGRRGVASEPFGALLESLRRDRRVVGVVLRVDSPGGDGLASDLLHRRLERLRAEKPVVVSMGEVAASGGYYLSAAGDAVLAEGPTVTGSIGVVGGKLDLSGLYERLGVGRDGVERGARAGFLSEGRPFTPAERSALRHQMEALYEAFLDRVARGRRLSQGAVRALAGGRVWSGARALEHGLVDRLGGPIEALAEVRRRAGLSADQRIHLDVHPRTPRFPSLPQLLGLLLRGRGGGP
ncbi:MAG: signal peptide peptidase SppA [Myxococcota bacterium]